MFAITESTKNIKYALTNITYKIGEHDILPQTLFTKDDNSSKCLEIIRTNLNTTCYLALTIDHSHSQIPVIYIVKDLGVPEITTTYLTPNMYAPLVLTIGLAVICLLFLSFFVFICYLAIFYTRHGRLPEKIDKWLQTEQLSAGKF